MQIATDMMFANMSMRTKIPTSLNEWLASALKASGMSQAALAEQLDARVAKKVDRSTINKMVLGKRVISAEEMLLISELTGVGLPFEAPWVAVPGFVGAGDEVELVDDYGKGAGMYRVPCPPQLSPSGVVALEIRGDSMKPVYQDGGIVFYTREALGVPHESIGKICVAEDEDGKIWLKHVRGGTDLGRYHLFSLNPDVPSMQNHILKWAAPIRFYLPPDMVRHIDVD